MIKKDMVIFLIMFVVLSLSLIVLIYYTNGRASIDGVDFIAKGKEAGLNSKDIKLLKKTAALLNIEKPLTLLGSLNHINDAIQEINTRLENGNYQDQELMELLEDLYKYRKRIELEKIERRGFINNSRDIEVNQQVKITIGNLEKPIIGNVKECTGNYLTIDLLHNTVVRPGINWDGPINIYFWKQNDAGYYFESQVIESLSSRSWRVTHSSSLIRSQKRNDVRVDLQTNCFIYKLDDISKSNSKTEGFSGAFGQLKNISEGGAAFLINGKLAKTTPIKIEFKLLDKNVVVCGVVKDSSFNNSNNISYIRLKIVQPDFDMLSTIRSYLYIHSKNIEKENLKEEKVIKLEGNKVSKSVENIKEINNNVGRDSEEAEEVPEVEYITDGSEV